MAKKNGKKRILILVSASIGIVAAILVSVFLVTGKNGQWQWVESTLVEPADLSREITANGEIGSRESETLTARISGVVKSLPAATGDKVMPGTLICLLDDEKLRIQQQSALVTLENARRTVKEQLLMLRTAYTQAKTGADQARRYYENIVLAQGRGAASQEQLAVAGDSLAVAKETLEASLQKLNFREGRAMDDLRTLPFKTDDEIVTASGEVKEAEAALRSIEKNLADCAVYAGITGVITDLPVQTGSLVAPGTLLAALANPALLEVTITIDEVDIGYIRLNQEMRIESDAFIGTSLTARVTFIAPVIKKIGEARVCTVKASLADPGKKAKIGAGCSAFIQIEKREQIPAIPIESYIQDKEKKYAFKIIRPGTQAPNGICKLEKIEIETGLMGVEKVEIVKGLAAGAEIVKNNLKNIKEDTRVKIKVVKEQL